MLVGTERYGEWRSWPLRMPMENKRYNWGYIAVITRRGRSAARRALGMTLNVEAPATATISPLRIARSLAAARTATPMADWG